MTVLLALIKKELIQTFRDARLRVVIFLVPMIQVTLFGFALSTDVKNIDTTICDLDRTPTSREVISILERGGYFRIQKYVDDPRMAQKDIDRNITRVALILPHGFEARIKKGLPSDLQVILAGSNGNSATISYSYIQSMLRSINYPGNKIPRTLLDFVPPKFQGISWEPRTYYNPEMESKFFLLPGIGAMLLTIIVTLLTAMGVTREIESGTFDQLIVSPIHGWQLILGKTLPFLLVGVIDVILLVLITYFVFGVSITGSLWVFALVNVIYVFVMLGLGLLISTLSASQSQAMMTTFALLFPFIILSDFIFPVSNMPWIIQKIALGNPMYHQVISLRFLFLRGSGFLAIQEHIYWLIGFAFLFLSVGTLRMRKILGG